MWCLFLNKKELVLVSSAILVSAFLSYIVTSSYYISYYTLVLTSRENECIEVVALNSKLLDVAKKLNTSLSEVVSILQKYCCIPWVLPTVLNEDEVRALKWYIVMAGVDPHDEWVSIERVYRWITRNIKYVADPQIAVPRYNVTCLVIEEEPYCYYEFRELREYVQSPTETIRRGGGDCEDHAILTYAMLTYYFKYIRRANYTLWLTFINLGDGSKHAAVFIPVKGGGLLIIDTSLGYITATNDVLSPKPVMEELENYSYFFIENGGIDKINLYVVDIENRTYRFLISGGLATIASYIERYIGENPNYLIRYVQ